MALFYTDKSGQSRGAPTVNSGDVHHNRKAHATDSLAPRATGTETGGKVVTKNDQIKIYDTDNERIVIGRLPDGTYGMVISKEGFNVSDAFS